MHHHVCVRYHHHPTQCPHYGNPYYTSQSKVHPHNTLIRYISMTKHANLELPPNSHYHANKLLLELSFLLNPSTSQLTLPILWTISKSYSYKINAHLANFLVRQYDSIKNFKGYWFMIVWMGYCRAPKFLVDPFEGPSMRQCRRSWNLEHDPNFQH